ISGQECARLSQDEAGCPPPDWRAGRPFVGALTDMDAIDRRILDLLRADARLPLKTIAGAVALARSSVAARIARLESDGIITGYRAEIAPDRTGGTGAVVSLE